MNNYEIKQSWVGHLAKQTAKRKTKRKIGRKTKQAQRRAAK